VTGPSPLVTLQEWEETTVRAPAPAPADQALADRLREEHGAGKLDVEWRLDGRVRVRSTSWIGSVRFESLEVRVVPKYVGEELGVVRMLDYIEGIGRLRRIDIERSLPSGGTVLVELVCRLLADEAVNVLRAGLVNDYVTEDGTLAVLRGSLRVREQATRRFGRVDVLECRYDDHHGDIAENRLLAAGLGAARRVTADSELRRTLGALEAAVVSVCTTPTFDAAWYRQRVRANRRTEHYRAAHSLSLAILDGLGIPDWYAGGQLRSFTFLLDMNRVFEDFAGALLDEALRGSGWAVSTSRRLAGTVWNEATGRSYTTLRPDLVLSHGRRAIPVDAKYKRFDRRAISSADIYQAFLYAFALAGGADPLAVLCHPGEHADGELYRLSPQLSIRTAATEPPAARVIGLGIDVRQVLAALARSGPAWTDALHQLRATAASILGHEPGGGDHAGGS
jgi:5-methylcytosine-specific restriction enzyme subunit McrC